MAQDPTLTDETPKPVASEKDETKKESTGETTFLGYLREWSDALVIAFVVAMFIRMFVVELFKIPSGSMSPTLLGDWVAEGVATDLDGESHQYLLILDRNGNTQIFEKQSDGHYIYEGRQPAFALTASQKVLLDTKLKREEHRILVNKFAYWFKSPDRGDIAIFRVPFKLEPEPFEQNGVLQPGTQYDRNQNVYVKRVAALEGEQLSIGDDGHLYIDGEMVTAPEILTKLQYQSPPDGPDFEIDVPEDSVIMLGDNSGNSLDSRFWGPLPEEYLRGKALFTYYPFKKMKLLSP